MDLRRRAWDPVLLGLFGIPAAALPPIRPTTAPGASIRIRGREIPILATLGDQQSALIGLGCLRPGDLAVNYGTGGFVVMNTGRRPRRSAGLLTSAAWSTPLETRYLLEGTINSAGSALDWMERIAGFPSRSKRRIPDLDRMPVLIPAFAGLAAPHWASEARGALLDLTLDTEAGDLHVATLAGLACRVREIVEAMEAGGAEIRRIVAGGGLVRNPGLLPIQAAILGRSVHRADGEEATARGAALLAGHAAGEWRLEDFAASAGTGLAIRPAISRLAANRYFTRFRAAVATLTGHPRGSRLGRDRGRGLR
jgi:glycerol kinase